jgi:tetratricopeptide (TPR) repeat protein
LTVDEPRLEELRRRVAEDPGSRLFAQLAEEYRKAGASTEAVRVARAGLALHPVCPAARLTLGRALLESGDARAARLELAEAARQAPENIPARRFLAIALEAAGELEQAARQYAETLRLSPGDRDLLARLSGLQTRLAERAAGGSAPGADGDRSNGEAPKPARMGEPPPKEPPLAEEAQVADRGEAIVASGPTPFSSPTLAELYFRQGFVKRAIEVYRRVVSENPDHEGARARLAEIEALEGGADGEQAEDRRRRLRRTIDCLEALLGAAKRR